MTYTNWEKLRMRLQAVANNKNGNKQAERCPGVALVMVNLILSKQNKLVGWYKPQRIELEPKTLDWLTLDCYKINDGWDGVVKDLQSGKNDCALIVSDGLPVAWLA